MPHKDKRGGIYVITTPAGNEYVGSSVYLRRRWCEHLSELRSGSPHSSRLQAAWNKYGSKLAFSVLEYCAMDSLTVREQHWVNLLNPRLNMATEIINSMSCVSARLKFKALQANKEWRRWRHEIYLMPNPRWQEVDCSDGTSYPSMKKAADAFGVHTTGMRHLCSTQRIGKLGVRFKLKRDEWRDVLTSTQQRRCTMALNGTMTRSLESRKRMSESAKRRGDLPRNEYGQFERESRKRYLAEKKQHEEAQA